VPLMIEKGKIQAGKMRLSRGLDVMKANLKGAGGKVPKDWQVNHLIPDEIAQRNPLMIEALKRDLFNVDRASNLLPMPGKAGVRKANLNLIGHQGSHGDYSRLINQELSDVGGELIREYGSLGKVPEAELMQAIKDIENSARTRILKNSKSIPTRVDPNTGTRVISDANLDDQELVGQEKTS
jgi:A nuclease family of the HNH/ENDO VII superfamily with conserved AHH